MSASRVNRIHAVALSVVALLLAMSAATAFGRQDAASAVKQSHNPLRAAPAKDLAKSNPLDGEPDAIAAGEKLYSQHCAECHGKKSEGTRRAPSLLSREVQDAPAGAIYWLLTNGSVRRGMPVWSKLPEARRWQIVAFLKSLQHAQESRQDGN